MHIFVGMAIYAMSRDFHQFSLLAKHQRICWAGFHACGLLPCLQSLIAHVALHDPWIPRVILGFWNVKRTGNHAKPASQAFVSIPGNGPFLGLEHCVHQTHRYARGLPAVHALPLDEYFSFFGIETIDNRELLFARIPAAFKCVVAVYVRSDTHAACQQCMHCLLTNTSPFSVLKRLTTVNCFSLVSLRLSSALSLFTSGTKLPHVSEHATSHDRQPIHLVVS